MLGTSRTFAYDTASRLASVTDGSYTATYGYLANSPLWGTLTFSQGATVRATTSRDFDLLNRLRVVSTAPAGGGSGWTSRYAYNTANQRTRRTDADGSFWVYQYDALGQVVSGKRFWADGTPVAGQQYEYAYDDIGNRTASKEGGDDSGQGLRSSAYSRNNLNQYTARTNAPFLDVVGLAHAGAAVTVNGVAASRRGEYFRRELAVTNAAGPVATATTVAALSGASSSNLVGTLLSPPASQVLTYDADGNLLSDGLWEYTWDGENRLLSIQSPTTLSAAHRRKVSWEYDPAGRRIRQTTAGWNNTTWTNATDLKLFYDGWACLAELNATNNAFVAGYAWGLDLSGTPTGAGGVGGLLWMRPNGGAAHFAAYDGNGNVIGLVDGSTGLESARYEYDTFGNTIRLTGTGTIAKDNPFRFSTKRTERESGLVLYEYRPYSTFLGRWPNRDPIGEQGGINLYAFAFNDPGNRVDIFGHSTESDLNDPSSKANQDAGLDTGTLDDCFAKCGGRPDRCKPGYKYQNLLGWQHCLLSCMQNYPPTHPGFRAPKKPPYKRKGGWVDRNGDIWRPTIHPKHDPHYDVQAPEGPGHAPTYPEFPK